MNVSALLKTAVQHHQAGRLDQARRIYEDVLRIQPGHPDALHLLGLVFLAARMPDKGHALISRAVAAQPANPQFQNSLGEALRLMGRLDEAAEAFSRAASLRPSYAEAHYNLGLVRHAQGRLDEAAAALERALKRQPAFAAAHNGLGVVRRDLGQREDALRHFRRATQLAPRFVPAWLNLAHLQREMGDRSAARASYEKARALAPDHPDVEFGLAALAGDDGDIDGAIQGYRKAIAAQPDFAEAHINLGNALLRKGLVDEAVECLRRAAALNPRSAEAFFNLGNALDRAGRLAEAADFYERAASLKPGHVETHLRLAAARNRLGRHHDAISAAQAVLAIDAGNADAWFQQATALRSLGRIEDAVAAYRRAIESDGTPKAFQDLGLTLAVSGRLAEGQQILQAAIQRWPDEPGPHAAMASSMLYDDAASGQDILSESLVWARLATRGITPMVPVRRAGAKLRIGYVSPDLRLHSCAYFLGPLIANHDRDRFEIFAYAEVDRPDHVTEALRPLFTGWRNTVGMSDADLAARIDADGIDILVDLAGHTTGNRLGVFARKPAPVQATWLGYPATTGLSTIDYRLTDGIADPVGETDAHYVESLVRLDRCFLCYAPALDAPEVVPPPSVEAGRITFGSFNNAAKITPAVVATWAEIMRAVPDARLVMKAQGLSDPYVADHFRALFTAEGIEPERVEILGWRDDVTHHLAAYGMVDIALDPFPYNGTTTTCEALWMGVPVVTLAGRRHAGRVGASLLTHLGLPELIATSRADYVQRAAALAVDRARLKLYRETMRERMRRSPLLDGTAFARAVERAYRGMWSARGPR